MFQYRVLSAGVTADTLSCKVQDISAPNEATILALLDRLGIDLGFARHAVIFQEKDQAAHFYRLVKGTVQLSKLRINGRRQIVRLVLPGDLFGFEADELRRLTAESLDEAVVAQYPTEVLDQIGNGSPQLHRAVMRFLRLQLFSTQEHAVMLGRQTALERVAAFLHLLAKRKNIKNGGVLMLPMRRRDFADYLGLSVETVSRMLTKLKDAGLIAVSKNHGKFVIRDIDSLEDVMLDAKAYGLS
ncbi:MAG: helix-turn-helix domain-containing protein [Alphaproteobacteria bacterium]|nr:helix-turn-helix domain-containing protein [Alphaproteobacteria bacterium]MDE2013767.1 helix-turn-helix domain-containing protein [Alphaproteobacteria bacterium]MDE2073593.1 helix-turn-helix domain-containing protein [Alphaproteobacteria bacterium]MDE2350791.1 helix-turn-helix domain-containing protein [Alphaproteobacteria bacterium]